MGFNSGLKGLIELKSLVLVWNYFEQNST
jgi:hypothetical protein